MVVKLVRIKVGYYRIGLEICEKKFALQVGLMWKPTTSYGLGKGPMNLFLIEEALDIIV